MKHTRLGIRVRLNVGNLPSASLQFYTLISHIFQCSFGMIGRATSSSTRAHFGGTMQFSASTTVPRFVNDLLTRLRLQANGDAYATGEDAGFTFTSADLLANDGGVTKSFVSVQTTSAMGAAISGQNGVFTYDAGARFDYLGD